MQHSLPKQKKPYNFLVNHLYNQWFKEIEMSHMKMVNTHPFNRQLKEMGVSHCKPDYE